MNCRQCKWFVSTMDQGSIGGGVDNNDRCRKHSAFEDSVRAELAAVGDDGETHRWLVAQTGYAVSVPPHVPEPYVACSVESRLPESLFEAIDATQEGLDWSVELRDPVWEAWDAMLDGKPRMEFVQVYPTCRRCGGSGVAHFTRRNGEHDTGSCFRCSGSGIRPAITGYERADWIDPEWTMTTERKLVYEVMDRFCPKLTTEDVYGEERNIPGCVDFAWKEQEACLAFDYGSGWTGQAAGSRRHARPRLPRQSHHDEAMLEFLRADVEEYIGETLSEEAAPVQTPVKSYRERMAELREQDAFEAWLDDVDRMYLEAEYNPDSILYHTYVTA